MNGSQIICDNSCVHYGSKKKVMIISLMKYLRDIQILLCTYRHCIISSYRIIITVLLYTYQYCVIILLLLFLYWYRYVTLVIFTTQEVCIVLLLLLLLFDVFVVVVLDEPTPHTFDIVLIMLVHRCSLTMGSVPCVQLLSYNQLKTRYSPAKVTGKLLSKSGRLFDVTVVVVLDEPTPHTFDIALIMLVHWCSLTIWSVPCVQLLSYNQLKTRYSPAKVTGKLLIVSGRLFDVFVVVVLDEPTPHTFDIVLIMLVHLYSLTMGSVPCVQLLSYNQLKSQYSPAKCYG
jgi:hypothetical protein